MARRVASICCRLWRPRQTTTPVVEQLPRTPRELWRVQTRSTPPPIPSNLPDLSTVASVQPVFWPTAIVGRRGGVRRVILVPTILVRLPAIRFSASPIAGSPNRRGGPIRFQMLPFSEVGGRRLSPGLVVTCRGWAIFPPRGPRSSHSPDRSGAWPGFCRSAILTPFTDSEC